MAYLKPVRKLNADTNGLINFFCSSVVNKGAIPDLQWLTTAQQFWQEYAIFDLRVLDRFPLDLSVIKDGLRSAIDENIHKRFNPRMKVLLPVMTKSQSIKRQLYLRRLVEDLFCISAIIPSGPSKSEISSMIDKILNLEELEAKNDFSHTSKPSEYLHTPDEIDLLASIWLIARWKGVTKV
jgi:hypothetical protein